MHSNQQKRNYTQAEKADLDTKTSDNKIGEIINLSQELNSLLWHKLNNGSIPEDIYPIYYDICQLDVMSGIEIDKAKKEFVIDMNAEMKRIRKKYLTRDEHDRMIKPHFFGHLAKQKGYYDSAKKDYRRFDTAMDYLQRCINKFQHDKKGKAKQLTFEPLSFILNYEGFNQQSVYYEQVNKVIKVVSDMAAELRNIYADDSFLPEEKYRLSSMFRQSCQEYVGKLKFSRSTMLYLIRLCESDEYKQIKRTIINTLFGYPNSTFYEVILASNEPLPVFKEMEKGSIKVFDINFEKITDRHIDEY